MLFSPALVNCKEETDELIRENQHVAVQKMAVEIGIGHHAFQEMVENSAY
jgi:hypothetical protein